MTTQTPNRQEELRRQALRTLQESGVLMRDGHFDYGNGYHGRVYLNPHELFRYPSTIWRIAQDLIDILPSELLERTEVVAGPAPEQVVPSLAAQIVVVRAAIELVGIVAAFEQVSARSAHAYRYECSDTPLISSPSQRCLNSVARSPGRTVRK